MTNDNLNGQTNLCGFLGDSKKVAEILGEPNFNRERIINYFKEGGDTLLNMAIAQGTNQEFLEWKKKTNQARSFLLFWTENIETVRSLIEAGADVKKPGKLSGKKHLTPLDIAADYGKMSITKNQLWINPNKFFFTCLWIM